MRYWKYLCKKWRITRITNFSSLLSTSTQLSVLYAKRVVISANNSSPPERNNDKVAAWKVYYLQMTAVAAWEWGNTTFLFLPHPHFKFNDRYLNGLVILSFIHKLCTHWRLPIRCLPNSFSIVCTVWFVAVIKFHSHSTFSQCDGGSCNNQKPPVQVTVVFKWSVNLVHLAPRCVSLSFIFLPFFIWC